MAIGKGSLERVAKAAVPSPAQEEITATAVPVQKETIAENKPKKASAKKAETAKKAFAVGDTLPEYLL